MSEELEFNEVREVSMNMGDLVAPIRFHLGGDYLALRAEPGKGDPREPAALEIIARYADELRGYGVAFQPFERKSAGQNRVDVLVISRQDLTVDFLASLPYDIRIRIGIN